MPFPNFHAARIKSPGLFVRIRQINTAENGAIRFLGGPLKTDPTGGVEVQAIRFDKDRFTATQAREWLRDHDFASAALEEATEDHADERPFISEDQVLRFDEGSIGSVRRADDGSIVGEAVITRAGVFKYRMPDGSTRSELRPPEEVFKHDSLRSAKMLPITNRHPSEFVSPGNAKQLAIGFTGETVRRDGYHVLASVKINTSEGIAAVDAGRRQLSLGYTCSVEEEAGRFDGEDYTHVQRGIGYNHLALVDRARAGDMATLRLDAEDAVMSVEEDTRKESRRMVKVRLDSTGIEYDVPPEVKAELDRLGKERNDANERCDALTKERDALTGERDELKERAEKAEKVDHSEAIAEGVKAKLDAMEKAEKAKTILGEEEQAKLDGKSEAEIRDAVIAAKYPNFDFDGKSDDYLNSRFDAIIEAVESEADDDTAQKNADAVLGDAKRNDGVKKSADQIRQDAIAKMCARSRGEE
jgi:hypothetical protein